MVRFQIQQCIHLEQGTRTTPIRGGRRSYKDPNSGAGVVGLPIGQGATAGSRAAADDPRGRPASLCSLNAALLQRCSSSTLLFFKIAPLQHCASSSLCFSPAEHHPGREGRHAILRTLDRESTSRSAMSVGRQSWNCTQSWGERLAQHPDQRPLSVDRS